MINRSIDRDYDIPSHIAAINKCLEDLEYHIDALDGVGYDPLLELRKINEFCVKLTTNWY